MPCFGCPRQSCIWVDRMAGKAYTGDMPRTAEASRFLRAAVKAGLRLQRERESVTSGQTLSSLQRIKASVRKTEQRRAKQP
jgi:hypothetical protein